MKQFYFIGYNHIIKLISEGKNYKGETHDQFLRIISYLEKQLELFSNLCFGRNFLNKKIMREKLKSSVLLEYIWNRELPAELRAAFVSLLLQTHIDSISKNERIVPMFTKKFISNPTKQTKKEIKQIFLILLLPKIPIAINYMKFPYIKMLLVGHQNPPNFKLLS